MFMCFLFFLDRQSFQNLKSAAKITYTPNLNIPLVFKSVIPTADLAIYFSRHTGSFVGKFARITDPKIGRIWSRQRQKLPTSENVRITFTGRSIKIGVRMVDIFNLRWLRADIADILQPERGLSLTPKSRLKERTDKKQNSLHGGASFKARSRTTSEPPGSSELSASRSCSKWTSQESSCEVGGSDVVHELSREPPMFQFGLLRWALSILKSLPKGGFCEGGGNLNSSGSACSGCKHWFASNPCKNLWGYIFVLFEGTAHLDPLPVFVFLTFCSFEVLALSAGFGFGDLSAGFAVNKMKIRQKKKVSKKGSPSCALNNTKLARIQQGAATKNCQIDYCNRCAHVPNHWAKPFSPSQNPPFGNPWELR